MNRKKLFIENIFAYGFINGLNKIIPFLLLPVITRMLPNASDFGIYSMFTTIVGFGTPLAVLGLYDAMLREYFEKEDMQYKYNVTTTTQRIIIFSSISIASIMLILNRSLSSLFFGNVLYSNLIMVAGIGVLLGALLTPIQAPTRMQNQRKVFIASGLISAVVTYAFAIILIYYGLSYYSLIYSSILSTLALLMFFWVRNSVFFTKGRYDKKIAKELFKIGLPLIPTFLIYWIYNSMDKIMITNMLGTLDLGIYSIGSKMAQISLLVYASFAGGWQYFAFSTMKDKDQVQLNSKIFEYLGALAILSFIIIYPVIPLVFKFLFTGDYVSGYIVMPYLFLSPLLLMLFQVAGNQFLVVKKSILSTISLFIGAIINIILNLTLIKLIGIEGAAIATLISYLVTLFIVIVISKKMKLMIYGKRIISVLLILPIYIIVQRLVFVDNTIYQFGFMLTVFLVFMILFRFEINLLLKKIKGNKYRV